MHARFHFLECRWLPGTGDATSSFYFVKNLEVMVAFATATNRTADVVRYIKALKEARAGYYAAYYNKTTQNFGPTQTGNALGIIASPAGVDTTGAVQTLLSNIKVRSGGK